MQNLRVLLREAEEALIQLNLAKAKIAEEYAKQVELAEGAVSEQEIEQHETKKDSFLKVN